MPVNIFMPALSPTMEKGNLAKWLKKEGDKIKPGDVIAEIETDKATMEYEAIDEGTLARIVVPEGSQDVPVNQLIAVLAQEGEDVKATAAAVEKGAAATAKPRAIPTKSGTPAIRSSQPTLSPQAPAAAFSLHSHEKRRDEAVATIGSSSNRIYSSPLARRLAKEAALDLARITGSGPHGRIIARDVEAAKSSGDIVRPGPTPVPSAAPAGVQTPSDEKIRALFEAGSHDVIPHDNMRRVIARRLVEAKLTIPHFYLTLDCAIGKLLAAREVINAAAPKDKDGYPAYKIPVNDFAIKALSLALQRVPDANVTWTEAPCSSTGIPISALRFRSPEGSSRPLCVEPKQNRLPLSPTR